MKYAIVSDIHANLEALQAVGGNVLGLVVNRIPTKGADAESYYYREGYAPQLPARSRKERAKDRRSETAGV